jgi:hypothetical protein
MMLLFNFLLLLASGVHKLLACRAARLERKFARLAREVNDLSHGAMYKEGNSARHDVYQAAKRQYLLGALVHRKDRVEACHDWWAQRAEKAGQFVSWLQHCKGRLLPYVVGALDTIDLGCLVDYLTLGDFVRLRQMVDLVQSWFTA